MKRFLMVSFLFVAHPVLAQFPISPAVPLVARLQSFAPAPDAFPQQPQQWYQNDPADSLYRLANQYLARRDYRRAAELFGSIPEMFPKSQYASDALYWQAFSLYQTGGTDELKRALEVLEKQRTTYRTAAALSARARFGQFGGSRVGVGSDADALMVRIAGTLSERGLGKESIVERALNAPGNNCNQDDLAMRVEALSVLTRTDPVAAQPLARRLLSQRDACSAPLRRSAVFLVGSQQDYDKTMPLLIDVAKNDPAPEVRYAAINWLSQVPRTASVTALTALATSPYEPPPVSVGGIQPVPRPAGGFGSVGIRGGFGGGFATVALGNYSYESVRVMALTALANNPNPEARKVIQTIAENEKNAEPVRLAALETAGRWQITADDGTWLRNLYEKTPNARVREAIVGAIGRKGGAENLQWTRKLTVTDVNQPLEARLSILRRADTTMDIATLRKVYETSPRRSVGETIVGVLQRRDEPAAVDLLIDIAKKDPDPVVRRGAITALAAKRDPRTTKLLLQIFDK